MKPGHPRRREALRYKRRVAATKDHAAIEVQRGWLAADYAMRIFLPRTLETAKELSSLAASGRGLGKIETVESLAPAIEWLRQIGDKLVEIFGEVLRRSFEATEPPPNRSKRGKDRIRSSFDLPMSRISTIAQFALVLAGTDLAKLPRAQRRRLQKKQEAIYLDECFAMLDQLIAIGYRPTLRDAETLRASLPPRAQEGIDALLARGATLALQPGGAGLLLTCEAASTPDGLRAKLSKSLPGSRWSTELDGAVTLHWWA